MTVDVSPIVAEAARWLEARINDTPHGEISLTFRLHADRAPLEERTILSRTKHETVTGKSGGSYEHRRR